MPVPEKYFTPLSWLSLQEESLSITADAGAPRPGWKVTFQEPSTVVNCVSVIFGKSRDGAVTGLRNTTNTVPHGSRCNGTVVPAALIWYAAGSNLPDSACHNSASLPVTRKVASTVSSRSLRLSTK